MEVFDYESTNMTMVEILCSPRPEPPVSVQLSSSLPGRVKSIEMAVLWSHHTKTFGSSSLTKLFVEQRHVTVTSKRSPGIAVHFQEFISTFFRGRN